MDFPFFLTRFNKALMKSAGHLSSGFRLTVHKRTSYNLVSLLAKVGSIDT